MSKHLQFETIGQLMQYRKTLSIRGRKLSPEEIKKASVKLAVKFNKH
jgi:hypothetical protein